MGKYDGLDEAALIAAWNAAKAGVNKPILKALAAHGTPSAAEFVHGCIQKQATSRSAHSVIEVLISMGAPAAPWLVRLITYPDSVQDARVREWVAALGAMGEAGVAAARVGLAEALERYRGLWDETQAQLESLPAEVKEIVWAAVRVPWSVTLGDGDRQALEGRAELLEDWLPHLLPEIRSADLAVQHRSRLLNSAASAIENLSLVVGEPLEPRRPEPSGSLGLHRV